MTECRYRRQPGSTRCATCRGLASSPLMQRFASRDALVRSPGTSDPHVIDSPTKSDSDERRQKPEPKRRVKAPTPIEPDWHVARVRGHEPEDRHGDDGN